MFSKNLRKVTEIRLDFNVLKLNIYPCILLGKCRGDFILIGCLCKSIKRAGSNKKVGWSSWLTSRSCCSGFEFNLVLDVCVHLCACPDTVGMYH